MFDRQNYVAQLNVSDDIDNEQATNLADELDKLGRQFVNVPGARILLNINSNGGSLYDANAILCSILTCSVPVDTLVSGAAFSPAFLISTAGAKRYCTDLSSYMFHGISVAVNMNTMDKVHADISHSEKLQSGFSGFIQSRTKIPKKKMVEMIDSGKDYYFTPQECKKLGVVDEIILM